MTLFRFPFFVYIWLIYSFAMVLPGIVAWQLRLYAIMQTFFTYAIFLTLVGFFLGFLLYDRKIRGDFRDHLGSLLLTYLILPFFLAMPLFEVAPHLGYGRAVFEMLSSLTTTGMTVFDSGLRVPVPIYFYSVLVAWIGGFLILLIAFAIMEPMDLGGFELRPQLQSDEKLRRTGGAVGNSERLRYQFRLLAPAYVGATAFLTLLLQSDGERLYYAISHAMSTMSTSGLSPAGSYSFSGTGRLGELFIALFLFFALSHRFILAISQNRLLRQINYDPELRLAAFLLIGMTVLLFTHHWFGAYRGQIHGDLGEAGAALWGSFFTALSFLTTTGFISEDWIYVSDWSGLQTPGTIFLGFAVIGGGVATTAGGVKLLRVFALLRLTKRELERVADPHSIGAAGRSGRELRKKGAVSAWLFLMLFILGISCSMLFLSISGMHFFEALVVAVASATNCGPVISLFPEFHIDPGSFSDAILFFAGLTMIFGRMEVLVLITLFNPNFWLRK